MRAATHVRSRGLSLIEILVAMSLFVLLAAISFMVLKNRSVNADPERETQILLGYLRDARERGTTVQTYGNPTVQGYFVGTSEETATGRHPYPAGITSSTFKIVFAGAGAVSGDASTPAPDANGRITIELKGQERTRSVSISTSTGFAELGP